MNVNYGKISDSVDIADDTAKPSKPVSTKHRISCVVVGLVVVGIITAIIIAVAGKDKNTAFPVITTTTAAVGETTSASAHETVLSRDGVCHGANTDTPVSITVSNDDECWTECKDADSANRYSIRLGTTCYCSETCESLKFCDYYDYKNMQIAAEIGAPSVPFCPSSTATLTTTTSTTTACPCSSSTPLTVPRQLYTTDAEGYADELYNVNSTYGVGCLAHDLNVRPDCLGNSPPDDCDRVWCFTENDIVCGDSPAGLADADYNVFWTKTCPAPQ